MKNYLTNVTHIQTCQINCSICKHPLKEEIHALRDKGETFDSIVETINKKTSRPINKGSLSRHFAKVRAAVAHEVAKQEVEVLKKQATDVLTYQAWTNKLLQRTFKRIWEHFDNMELDISDLERLAKLRVLLKEGDTGAGEDISDLFTDAARKYGINLDQSSLFETEPKKPFKNAIDVTPTPTKQEPSDSVR